MIRHIVLFQFQENCSEERVEEIVQAFLGLKNQIESIRDIEQGLNISKENLDQGITHCFQVTFENKQGLETYLPHPEHEQFKVEAGPCIKKAIVVDYEV